MKKLKIMLAGLLVVPTLALGVGAAVSSDANAQVRAGLDATGQQNTGTSVDSDLVQNVVNWMLFAMGFIAVIMLIWGGFTYATSAGDTTKVERAKQTVLYAVIGLIVAILAYAIVAFINNQLNG